LQARSGCPAALGKRVLAGNFKLQQQNDRPMAALVNNGNIQVSDGGFVVLTSPLLHLRGEPGC